MVPWRRTRAQASFQWSQKRLNFAFRPERRWSGRYAVRRLPDPVPRGAFAHGEGPRAAGVGQRADGARPHARPAGDMVAADGSRVAVVPRARAGDVPLSAEDIEAEKDPTLRDVRAEPDLAGARQRHGRHTPRSRGASRPPAGPEDERARTPRSRPASQPGERRARNAAPDTPARPFAARRQRTARRSLTSPRPPWRPARPSAPPAFRGSPPRASSPCSRLR